MIVSELFTNSFSKWRFRLTAHSKKASFEYLCIHRRIKFGTSAEHVEMDQTYSMLSFSLAVLQYACDVVSPHYGIELNHARRYTQRARMRALNVFDSVQYGRTLSVLCVCGSVLRLYFQYTARKKFADTELNQICSVYTFSLVVYSGIQLSSIPKFAETK